MSESKSEDLRWDSNFMICEAKSLQAVVNHLAADMELESNSVNSLFSGKIQSAPILMALATEIALKALKCQEGKRSPTHTHDLLTLFEELSENTQTRLEEGLPSQLDWVSLRLRVQEFSPIGAGMRIVLKFHRYSFERWRYKYESSGERFFLPELNKALTVIINTYDQIQAESHSVSNY